MKGKPGFDYEIPNYCEYPVAAPSFPRGETECEEPATHYVYWRDYSDGMYVCTRHFDLINETEKATVLTAFEMKHLFPAAFFSLDAHTRSQIVQANLHPPGCPCDLCHAWWKMFHEAGEQEQQRCNVDMTQSPFTRDELLETRLEESK